MAKGNAFMGTVKGRVGDNVFYVKQGEQNIIKYQPNVSNPKTGAQCIQRGKFGAAGKFFTHGTQALFKFAFESKKKGESDFNAFMRENISNAFPLSKQAIELPQYPVVNDWLVTKGSLTAPISTVGLSDYGNMVIARFDNISGDTTAPTTVAELTSHIISTNGYKEGDIVTFLLITSFAGMQDYPAINPYAAIPEQSAWLMKQIQLSLTDSTSLSSVGLTANVISSRCQVTMKSSIQEEATSYCGGTVIVSRKSGGKLKVSTNRLAVLNNYTFQPSLEAVKSYCATEAYKSQVISSWQDSENTSLSTDIILEGALVSKVTVTTSGVNPVKSAETESAATKFVVPFDPRKGALYLTASGTNAQGAIDNAEAGNVNKYYYNKTAGYFLMPSNEYGETPIGVTDNGDGTFSLWVQNANIMWYVFTAYEDERGSTLDFSWSLPN